LTWKIQRKFYELTFVAIFVSLNANIILY